MTRTFRLLALFVLALISIGTMRAHAQALLPSPKHEQEILDLQGMSPQQRADRTSYLNLYLDKCLKTADGLPDPEPQIDTCYCQTVQMGKYMPTPQIQSIATQRVFAPVNKTLLFRDIYGPCMEPTIVYFAKQQCYNNGDVQIVSQTEENYEGICSCVAAQAGIYSREMATPQLEAAITLNPALDDPLRLILDSSEYRNEIARVQKECIRTFVP